MTRFEPISFVSLLDVESMSPVERALAAKGIAVFTSELARCIAHYEGGQATEVSAEPVPESPVVEQPAEPAA